MANVRVRTRQAEDYKVIRSIVGDDDLWKFSDKELDSRIRFIEPGDDSHLQLFEIDYVPGTPIEIHAHEQDEIIYIVEGEMHAGTRVLGPGATLFVAGNTLYSFKAGPNGLRMLNFRPRADLTFITEEEFRKSKRAQRATA
jgi:quercetin dioxygenase-like cupin family protein